MCSHILTHIHITYYTPYTLHITHYTLHNSHITPCPYRTPIRTTPVRLMADPPLREVYLSLSLSIIWWSSLGSFWHYAHIYSHCSIPSLLPLSSINKHCCCMITRPSICMCYSFHSSSSDAYFIVLGYPCPLLGLKFILRVHIHCPMVNYKCYSLCCCVCTYVIILVWVQPLPRSLYYHTSRIDWPHEGIRLFIHIAWGISTPLLFFRTKIVFLRYDMHLGSTPFDEITISSYLYYMLLNWAYETFVWWGIH